MKNMASKTQEKTKKLSENEKDALAGILRKYTTLTDESIQVVVGTAKRARPGETWTINDKLTRGHKSTITRVKGEVVSHIPRSHAPKTRGVKNIRLQENPQKGDSRDAFVLPKVQKTKRKNLGKQQFGQDIKNATDKSVIRHLKKVDKKRKK